MKEFTHSLIDNRTNEIKFTEDMNLLSASQVARKKEYAKQKDIKYNFQDIQKNYLGKFMFFIYDKLTDLLKILNDGDFIKFIVTGTYINEYNYLMYDNKTYITKQELQNILHLSRAKFSTYYNKLLNNHLIQEDEDKIYINIEYFYKGKTTAYKLYTGNKMLLYTRVYIDTIRELYNTVPYRARKWLSNVYKLIPYVNWRHNVICKNPSEPDYYNIIPYTAKEVMIILGYNKTQFARFAKDLFDYSYNNMKAFLYVTSNPSDKTGNIFINPLFYYKGSNPEDVEYLIKLFGIVRSN